jgi:HEAT repeat protein
MSHVRWRTLVWAGVASLVLAAGIGVLPSLCAQEPKTAERPPVYRGRTLAKWLTMLDSGTDAEILLSIQAVGEFGPESRSHALAIAAKLRSTNREIRLAAAKQLAEWGSDAKASAFELALAMRDIDPEIGRAAAVALRCIGSAVGDDARTEVARAIEDRDSTVRENAMAVMTSIGWHEGSVAVLGNSLDSKDAAVRSEALTALRDVRPELAETLRAKVGSMLVDPDARVRHDATSTAILTKPDESLLPFMAAAIEHDDDGTKRNALNLASAVPMRELAKPLATKIAALLEDENVRVRLDAAMTLWILGHRDARAAGPLAAALVAEENLGQLRSEIVLALGELGPLANAAVPKILKYFESNDELKDEKFAASIGSTIGKIGPDAVKSLAGLLAARREDIRLATAVALESMGTAAAPATAELVAALADPDVPVRVRAAGALRQIGSDAKSYSEELAAATRTALVRYKAASGDPIFRSNRELFEFASLQHNSITASEEAQWLAAVGEAWYSVSGDDAAAAALETMLRDQSNPARTLALAAIDRSIENPAKSALPGLANVLRYCVAGYPAAPQDAREDDQRNYFRENGTRESIVHALHVVSRLGDDARSTFDSIATIAANDPRVEVALAASDAWWRLTSNPEAVKCAANCLAPIRFGLVTTEHRRELTGRAVKQLESMGDAAKVALPQITLAFQQETDDESKAAMGALIKKLDAEAAAKLGIE